MTTSVPGQEGDALEAAARRLEERAALYEAFAASEMQRARSGEVDGYVTANFAQEAGEFRSTAALLREVNGQPRLRPHPPAQGHTTGLDPFGRIFRAALAVARSIPGGDDA